MLEDAARCVRIRLLRAAVLVSVCATFAAGMVPRDSLPSTAAGSGESAGTRSLLDGAAKRYADHALGFSCVKRWTEVSHRAGGQRRESTTESAYLLVETTAQEGGMIAQRTVLRRERPGRRPRLDAPEPYTWTALLSRVLLRSAAYAGPDDVGATPTTLTFPFASASPVRDGRSVNQWSGWIEVDRSTGNLFRLKAEPNFQRATLAAKRVEYQQAMKIKLFGVEFRRIPPPQGAELDVAFAFKANGIIYPSRMTVTRFVPWGSGETRRTVTSEAMVEYSEYRFFRTGTQEKPRPTSRAGTTGP